MRNNATVKNLQFIDLKQNENKDQIKVQVRFKDQRNCYYSHHAIIEKNCPLIETYTTVSNNSKAQLKIEMLSSFSLSNLSPFNKHNISKNLLLTRFRSKWAMEGYPETEPIEKFQLEPSWKPSGAGVLKFGQVGSMPVRGFFPVVFVQDVANNCTWGIKIEAPASWQIEAYRLDEDLCLSGGIADRDYGCWTKTVNPGDSYTSDHAFLSVCRGDYQDCAFYLNFDLKANQTTKAVHNLPLAIEYNDFCFDWGRPTYEQINSQIAIAQRLGVKYFIIDAGWYGGKNNWEIALGDWKPSNLLFKNYFPKVVNNIRKAGMIPGIWFELENVGRASAAFNQKDHLLQKDGSPLTVGDRRFWDMNDPWVINYLKEKVINFLRDYNFGYLKIDYNENFGTGFDSPESWGAAARKQIRGTQNFIELIHQQLPHLIIENCASGGHRLETTFMKLTDLSSFSDSHETKNIPVIAANLHALMLPAQELVWAVLHAEDSLDVIDYTLISSFLGRPCLSGDLTALSETQIQEVLKGLRFYQSISPIIKQGKSLRCEPPLMSQRELTGKQVLIRYSTDYESCVVFIHNFSNSGGSNRGSVRINPEYSLDSIFGDSPSVSYNKGLLKYNFTANYRSVALKFLKK